MGPASSGLEDSEESSDERQSWMDRRHVLAATGAAGIAGLAGCPGLGGDGSDDDGSGDDGSGPGTITGEDSENLGEPVEELEMITFSESINPIQPAMGRYLVSDVLDPLGISSYLTTLGLAEYSERNFELHDWPLALNRYGAPQNRFDPDGILSTFFGDPENQFNTGLWAHDEFDRLVDEQAQTMEEEERQEIVYRLQEIYREELPTAMILNQPNYHIYRTDSVENLQKGVGVGYVHALSFLDANPGTQDAIRGSAGSRIGPLNPVASAEGYHAVRFFHRIYDRCMIYDLDGQEMDWLLTDVTVEDNTTVSGTLRSGMSWHDGEDVTGEDVAFTFEYMAQHESPQFGPGVADHVESVDVDGSEVTFNLSQPYAPFKSNVLAVVPIIPEHVWSEIDNPMQETPDTPIGSGPWMYVSHESENRHVLERNDDHFHPPEVENYYRIQYASSAAQVQSILQGDADVIEYTIGPQLAEEYRDPIQNQYQNVELDTFEHWGRYELTFQFADDQPDLPKSKPARHAIAHAIPQEDLSQTYFNGDASLHGDPIFANPTFSDDPTMPRSPAGDIEQARQILDEAGFGWDTDGRLHYPTGGIEQ